MKLGQTISWLYFWTFYCTGAKLYFIGWHCCVDPINSVAMPVDEYGGGKFLGIRLCLVPARETKKIFRFARLRRLLFSDIVVMLFTSPLSTFLNPCPRTQSDNICCKATWLSGLEYLQAYRLALICRYQNNEKE